jgi:RNA polymerase sigma-70 factor, ECF subfamily
VTRLDPEALGQHVDRLYRAAWALCGSPHDAEDLVQETFTRVLQRPRLLRGQDDLAYLMRALRNTFLTQRRSASRRPASSLMTLEDLEPADPRASGRPEQMLEAREVFEVIAELPENYRLALVAVDVVGLSYREAADALDTREATIATRVFRAREQAARKLSPPAASEPADEATPQVHAGDQANPASDQPDPLTSREDQGPSGSLVQRGLK